MALVAMKREDWQRIVSSRPRQRVPITVYVCDLAELIDAHVAALERLAKVEEWISKNAESDGLRAVLWPAKHK